MGNMYCDIHAVSGNLTCEEVGQKLPADLPRIEVIHETA